MHILCPALYAVDTYCVLMQTELQMQLAEYTAADWEGYKVMQLKIQALVSCAVLSCFL